MKLVSSQELPDGDAPISKVAEPFVGEYEWLKDGAAFFDFESLKLDEDGSFDATVDAKLVNPAVRTFGTTRCTLSETGVWNAYIVGDRIKLKIRPTTSRARVYEVTIDRDVMVLARRGGRAVLTACRSLDTTALEVA